MINFVQEAAAIQPGLVALRRELHRNPERGNQLPQTQARVLTALDGLPLEITIGQALTSVVAVLRGKGPLPEGAERPTVLLRGDMDALPVIEETGLDYASTNGLMHACGHDLHTAGLVGAARLLSAHIDEIPGEVIFMFQPGEEDPGGAEPMIAEGLLSVSGQKPDAAYAIHVICQEAAGKWSTRANTLMAGCLDLTITVSGRGGHGSMPYASVDPVPVAAEIVLALQAYVTRRVSVFDPVVITIGELHAGTAMNVIPDRANLHGSVRVLSRESIEQLQKDLPQLADGISTAHGCTAETDLQVVYPATVTDPGETDFVVGELSALFGAEQVEIMTEPKMGSEDFSFILDEVPGSFIFLGAHPDRSPTSRPPTIRPRRTSTTPCSATRQPPSLTSPTPRSPSWPQAERTGARNPLGRAPITATCSESKVDIGGSLRSAPGTYVFQPVLTSARRSPAWSVRFPTGADIRTGDRLGA